MPLSVIKVASGGLPVRAAAAPGGLPVLIATNGYGVAVTPVAAGGMSVTDVGGTLFGSATTTLNPADMSGTGVLTNGNLTFKNNNGSDARIGVRSIGGHTKAGGGKYYFEWTLNTNISQFSCGGISPVTQAYSTFTFNGAGGSGAATDGSGGMYVNGNINVVQNSGGTVLGDSNGMAIDFDNLKMWVYAGAAGQWNSGTLAAQNPATNTGGMNISALAADTYYVTVQLYGNQNQVTLNFGGSAYTFTRPAGFSNW